MLALALAAALPVLAASPWYPAIASALPGVRGRAEPAAARLAAVDLSTEYGQKLLTPLIPHLVAQGLGEETLSALPLSRRQEAVTRALEALIEEADRVARGVVESADAGSHTGDRLIEDAAAAEQLLLFAAPYLDEARRRDLARVEPHLKARAEELRRLGLLARARAGAAALGSRAEPVVYLPSPEESGLPGAQLTGEIGRLVRELAPEALVRVQADRTLSDGERLALRQGWDRALAGVQGWTSTAGAGRERGAALARLLAPLARHLRSSLSERAEPQEAAATLERLEALVSKAAPAALLRAPAKPPEQCSRRELTSQVLDLLREIEPRALDYAGADERRRGAWEAALRALAAAEPLEPRQAEKALAALRPRLKEYREHLDDDPLLSDDHLARASLLLEASELEARLKALAK